MNLIHDISPDHIFINGDLLDFYSLSKFDKSKTRAEDLQFELDKAQEFLKVLRSSCETSQITLISGNHENRLKKFLNSTNNKAIRSLISLKLENLIKLDTFNINFEPYATKFGSILIKHGDNCGLHPAKKELQKEMMCGISGHSHRTDFCTLNGYNRTIYWNSIGHLSDKEKLDKFYSESLRWDQSFAIIQLDKLNTDIEIVHCNSHGFFCKLNQKFYKYTKEKK